MPTQRSTIVVVEDDPSMSQAIQRLLRAAGLAPMTFPSAEAFLCSGQVADAACLVLDLHLPGIGGFGLHAHLAASGIDLPTIVITAQDRPSLRRESARIGVVDYLAKPFSGQRLIEAVLRALEISKQRLG
jgi:FixJ family two-component response regulator